jgi:Family of unknown function (DUF5677)
MDPDEPAARDARDGYAPIFDRLLLIYPESPELHVTPRCQKVAHLAHGWYMRCYRGAQAIVALGREGYAVEAAGIRRSIIEHVVALKWLAAEGDVILDSVARAHARGAERILAAATAADWKSIDPTQMAEIIASAGASLRGSENDYLSHFAHRAAKYADVHTMPGYLAECDQTHACYESAMAYVTVPDGSPLFTPRTAVPQVPFATGELLEATIALQPVFVDPPWAGALAQLRADFLVVTDAVREQDGLPPVDWSTGTLRDEDPQGEQRPDAP